MDDHGRNKSGCEGKLLKINFNILGNYKNFT